MHGKVRVRGRFNVHCRVSLWLWKKLGFGFNVRVLGSTFGLWLGVGDSEGFW